MGSELKSPCWRRWATATGVMFTLSGAGCRGADESPRPAVRTYEDRREPKDIVEPPVETKVTIWHPEKPLVMRSSAMAEDVDKDDPGRVILDVHEVEIRLGALEDETYTVILRFKADRAFLDDCIKTMRFRFHAGIFRQMAVPWDDARPIEFELHYSRRAGAIGLAEELEHMKRRSEDPDVFEPEKAIISGLLRTDRHSLAYVSAFHFRSVRQTLADGTVVGFDYKDQAEMLRRYHEEQNPPIHRERNKK